MALRPIVFLTDYGLGDEFVGICHGVIARIAPETAVIDLTHGVPRHDVLRGAVMLLRAARYMPKDAVYLGVVDPGVGSSRQAVAVEASSGNILVGPDNGLLSLAWEELGGAIRAVEITSDRVVLRPVSRTFHGRDVFAPAAAHLAAGRPLEDLGPGVPVGELSVLHLPSPAVEPGRLGMQVLSIDRFGNVQLTARQEALDAAGLRGELSIGSRRARVVGTFSDLADGELGVLVDSAGFLAIAVNQGSAASLLGVKAGHSIVLKGVDE